MIPDAGDWLRVLALVAHPEGGHFRETWRAGESLAAPALPPRFGGPRALGTAIYYLLRSGEHSRLHRLAADEVWHLYDGGPLHIHLLHADGAYARLALGRDLALGERPQWVVPRGTWFAAEPGPGVAHALAGCTVAPGFEYTDYEEGEREALLARYPEHRDLVLRLTPAPKGS